MVDCMTNPQKSPLNALIIEDNSDDVLLLVHALKKGDFDVSYTLVETPQDLENIAEQSFDIVYCDYALPKMDGLTALSIVRKYDADVPFIFVSGTIGEDLAVKAMRQGAQDYIMKDNLRRLVPATRREINDSQIRRRKREAEEHIHFLAKYDDLTSLPNRVHFVELLQDVLDQSGSQMVPVLHIDLDRFRNINDCIGYDAGNSVLKKIADRLSLYVGDRGKVSRLASDEFAVFFNRVESHAQIVDIARSILCLVNIPLCVYNLDLFFSSSIGMAVYPEHSDDAATLLSYADVATYRLKDEGGNNMKFYDSEMSFRQANRLVLERNMRAALSNQEFYLSYQPQLDLKTQEIVGVETLIRWNHPQKGIISPDDFIPLAEETGFVLALGEWVIDAAFRQAKLWENSFERPLKMAVNVSGRQFLNSDLPRLIQSHLYKHQVNPKHICIEITESIFMSNFKHSCAIVAKLKAMGLSVALDDFGTGYSSLAYLKMLEVDYLKIDQSFIRQLPESMQDGAIVDAIITLASNLNLQVIAEGVETKAQLDFLTARESQLVQGFFVSQPLTSTEFENYMNSSHHSNSMG